MLKKIQIRAKKSSTDYEGFIEYLFRKHPIINLHQVFIDVIHTKNKQPIKATCGKYNDICIVTIKLGVQYTLNHLLEVIAHEYCHILQDDTNMATYGSPERENAETQADLFATKELHQYLNLPLSDEIPYAFGYYQVTKDYIKEKGGILNAINNPPVLKEIYQ